MTPKQAARRAMTLTLGFDISVAIFAMAFSGLLVWSSESPRADLPYNSIALSTVFFAAAVAASLHAFEQNHQRSSIL